jgi:hypothetical protein
VLWPALTVDPRYFRTIEHASDVVRAHGETDWAARLIPLTVDGLTLTGG